MIRYDIVKEARTYLGTPFEHQGRLKDAGVDCVGLLVGVAKFLNLCNYDSKTYPREAPGGNLLSILHEVLDPIELTDAKPGDILVFWMNRRTQTPTHLAFMTDKGMIHTHQLSGKVVEHGFTKKWRRRWCATFKFPGVD